MPYMEPAGRKMYAVYIRRMQSGVEVFDREPYNIVEWIDPTGAQVQTGPVVEPVIAWALRSTRSPQKETFHGIRIYDRQQWNSIRFSR